MSAEVDIKVVAIPISAGVYRRALIIQKKNPRIDMIKVLLMR
jgi:hypothetical protein